jgi:hypothetical protein
VQIAECQGDDPGRLFSPQESTFIDQNNPTGHTAGPLRGAHRKLDLQPGTRALTLVLRTGCERARSCGCTAPRSTCSYVRAQPEDAQPHDTDSHDTRPDDASAHHAQPHNAFANNAVRT